MSLIFYEPFTSNIAFFTGVQTNGGKFAWVAVGPEGHPGIEMIISDTNPLYGYVTHSALTTETDARFGQYLNLDTISIPAGGSITLFVWRTAGGVQRSKLQLYNNSGTYNIIHNLRGDDGLVSQAFLSLAGASNIRWELHISKTNGQSNLYWDSGGGLTFKDTRSKTITTTFGDQTQIYCGSLDNPSASITGRVLFGPIGFRNDATALGAYSWSSPPTVTVPGNLNGLYDATVNTTGVSFSDSDTNVDEADIAGPEGLAITVVAGGATVIGNGTNAVNITGSNAQVLAALSSIDFNRANTGSLVWETVDTVTVTVYDPSAQDSDSFTITWVPDSGLNKSAVELVGTSAEIRTCLQAGLGVTPFLDFVGIFNIGMYSEVNTTPVLSDSDQYGGTVTDVANTAPRITPPGPLTAQLNVAKNISPGFIIEDDETNVVTVALTCTLGTLEISLTGSATIISGANQSASMVVAGTQSELNAVTSNMIYTGTSEGLASVTVLATDSIGATAQESSTISVSSVLQSISNTRFFQFI